MLPEQEYIDAMLERTALVYSKNELEKIRNTVFSISGLGGVGAITAELAARWGVKKFRLLDMDCYDHSNINRQLFATSNSVGRPKVEVAAERIKEINPYAEIEMIFNERVSNSNVYKFLEGAGILIQNADFPSHKLFNMAAKKYKIPLIKGYCTPFGAHVVTYDYSLSDCEGILDKLWAFTKFGKKMEYGELNDQEIEQFDKKYVHSAAPSLNFTTNLVGCLKVNQAIKLLTGKGKCIRYPRYLVFDTYNFKLKIRNTYSPLNPDNIERAINLFKRKLK